MYLKLYLKLTIIFNLNNLVPQGNYQPRQRYIYGRIVQGRPGRRVRARHVRPRPSAPVAEPAFNYVTECDNSNSRCESKSN